MPPKEMLKNQRESKKKRIKISKITKEEMKFKNGKLVRKMKTNSSYDIVI